MPNFNSDNDGVWFYFDAGDESKGGVKLRELSPSEAIRIDKITTKKRKKVVGGTLQYIDNVDTKTAHRLTWDFCIQSWKAIKLDGNEIPCTTDNKSKMMNVTDFAKWVVEKLEELSEINQSLDEGQEKNSETGLSGN
jgi:hypothetical protein